MREPSIKELLKLYEEGKATAQQRQQVEAFLEWYKRRDPIPSNEFPEEDSFFQEVMDKIGAAREQQPTDAPVYHLYGEDAARPRKSRVYGWVAAALVFLAVGGVLWKMNGRHPEPVQPATVRKTVVAKPGQYVHLLLADSSEVWLSAGGKLSYPQPFGDSIRSVELIDGEAYFQVHPDAKRGFEVKSDRLLTKVLGTSFNVKAYHGSQQMRVTVTTGKVSVGAVDNGQPVLLTARQQVSYNNGTGELTRDAVVSKHDLDWKSGYFSFEEESLGDIAIELEHYYNARIDFKYAGLRNYHVSASFSHETPLVDILNTLCQLNQNHVSQIDAQHYVIH